MHLYLLFFVFVHSLHPFYVSTTELNWSKKDKTFQITSKFFTDDLEKDLKKTLKFSGDLSQENTENTQFIGFYIAQNFTLNAKDKPVAIYLVGYEVVDDMTFVYLETEKLSKGQIALLSLTNTCLISTIQNQQNVIHLNYQDQHSTFLFNALKSTSPLF